MDDESIRQKLQEIDDPKESPSIMPKLKLENPEAVLEESISNIHFLRNIKEVKNKNIQDIYFGNALMEMTKMYSELRTTSKKEDEAEPKIPDHLITKENLKDIIQINLKYEISKETLELIFYALEIPLYEDTKIDFLLFVKIYSLIQEKIKNESFNCIKENLENISNEELDENSKENIRYSEEEELDPNQEQEQEENNIQLREQNEDNDQ